MTTAIVPANPDLAEHAAEIRRLGQHVIADIIEIGRHLTEAKAKVGHGHFGQWLLQEFNWTDRTARRFMNVYAMALDNGHSVSDLNLPMRSLYLLAAPSTPKEAVTEILDRAEAGEPLSAATVNEAITKAKGETPPMDDPEASAKAGWRSMPLPTPTRPNLYQHLLIQYRLHPSSLRRPLP